MFSTLKKFFGKRTETVEAPTEFITGAAPHPAQTFAARAARVDVQPRAAAPVADGNTSPNLAIPLKSILSRLPETLMQRVRQMDVGESEIFVPLQKILSQIAQGAVKISFGELRQMAPPGTFTPENDRDRMMVDLPLHEILCRLNPGLLTRRPVQKHVEVPAEVTGPFGGQSKVSFATSILKGPAALAQPVEPQVVAAQPIARAPVQSSNTAFRQATAAAVPAAPIRPVAPVQPAQRVPVPEISRQPVRPVQQVPPVQPPVQPVITARVRPTAPTQPAAPLAPQAPLSFTPAAPAKFSQSVSPLAQRPAAEIPAFKRAVPTPEPPPVFSPLAPVSEPEQAAPPAPISMSASFRSLSVAAPISPIAPVAEPEQEPIRFSPTVEATDTAIVPVPVVPVVAGETRFLTASLVELSQNWPESIITDIVQHDLRGSLISLPFGLVEAAIRQGKIVFSWKAIRSWIKAPAAPVASAHDATLLDLPLKIITPLFLAEMRSGRTQKKVAIDDAIPNLFTGSQPLNDAPATPPPAPVMAAVQPPVSAPTTQKPADTNYYVWKEVEEKPVPDSTTFLRKDGTPATAFLNRYATPNEIVTKAASLAGVDGALIALPDGLLVASRIPPTMNADTIAAFLPQIFGRVTQCTRELRLGELNNLNFTVGNVPWKIFRVGAIYFAVFGRPGEPLPTNQLVGIAAELDRKGK